MDFVFLAKLSIALLFIFITLFFLAGLYSIKLYVRDRRRSRIYMEGHRAYMRLAVFTTIVGVLFVEGFIRLAGGYQANTLFWVHLGFAVPFLLSLLTLAFWKNGLRSPAFHRKLGYFCLSSFVGVLLTGGILLFQY